MAVHRKQILPHDWRWLSVESPLTTLHTRRKTSRPFESPISGRRQQHVALQDPMARNTSRTLPPSANELLPKAMSPPSCAMTAKKRRPTWLPGSGSG